MTASAWVSILAALISTLSLLVALRALNNGSRSANSSEKSAETALRSVTGAESDRQRQILQSEQDQASKVFAWRRYVGSGDDASPPNLLEMEAVDEVQNTSRQPVFDVAVHVEDLSAPVGSDKFVQQAILLPSEKPRVIGREHVGPDGRMFAKIIILAVEFNDGQGRRWYRDTKGELRRL